MIRLPLYDLPALAEVERADPADLGALPTNTKGRRDCQRCTLGAREGLRNPCVDARGEPGGLLVVGEGVGAEGDQAGRPFVGQSGDYLQRLVAKHWHGPVAYDVATRCAFPKGAKDKLIETAVGACRGFLRQTLDEVKPQRVVAAGAWAAYSLLGRSIAPLSTRGGYGWLWAGGQPVPVFTVNHPAAALRNRFTRAWFDADFARAVAGPIPSQPPWKESARIIDSLDDARAAAAELREARWVAFDFETFDRAYDEGFRVLSAAMCDVDRTSPWVWGTFAMAHAGCRAILAELLADPRVKKCAQNGKFDGQAARAALGIEVKALYFDTRLVRHVLEPEADAHLDKQAELVGMGGHKEENQRYIASARAAIRAWASHRKKDGTMPAAKYDSPHAALARQVELHPENFNDDIATVSARPDWFTDRIRELAHDFDADELDAWSYALVPQRVMERYVALDTLTTARLGEHLEERLLESEQGTRVWTSIVRSASPAIEQVEAWGLRLDQQTIAQFDAVARLRLDDARQRLKVYGDFNPASPIQLRELLFKKLGLPVVATTDTNLASTDKDALGLLKGQHPIIEDLIAYRRYDKLIGTIAGWRRYMQGDGRIHTSLNIDGARSGRLSSSNPNLQNIDRTGSEEGKLARDCFVPAPGWELVEADYSQLELRIGCLLSGDQEMLKVFMAGADFHQSTAEFIAPIVWKIPASAVTPEHRSKTKTFVFGIIYGMTDGGIVARTGCTKVEAAAIRQAVMGRFKQLDRWVRERVREAQREGGCWTWWDGAAFRFRPLWHLGDADQDSPQVATARNASFNTPVQGTANEFCLASLIELVRWVKASGFPARVVLTVHDSILCETAPENVPALARKMRDIMTGWNSGPVPLSVDFKRGFAWGSLSKYNPDKIEQLGQVSA